MARKNYASKLTKEDLIMNGITLVTEDGLVFRGEQQVKFSINTAGYWVLPLYVFDENGNKIKKPITRQFKDHKKPTDTYIYDSRSIGLHRLMWAWFYNEVPEGMVIDHINNKHENLEDYHLSNLQLLTPRENLTKDRECNTRLIKCKLDKPREHYEEKLERYITLYEEAKKIKDMDKAHKLRGNIAHTRARLRYWDANRKEAETLMAKKKEYTIEEAARREAKKQSVKDRKLLEQYKIMFREAGNKDMWKQMIKVIKAWDSLEQIQKDHVFDTLHQFFNKYGVNF